MFGLLRYDLRLHDALTVFVYESHRLFGDRLVDLDSIRRFHQLLVTQLGRDWRVVPNPPEALGQIGGGALLAVAETPIKSRSAASSRIDHSKFVM